MNGFEILYKRLNEGNSDEKIKKDLNVFLNCCKKTFEQNVLWLKQNVNIVEQQKNVKRISKINKTLSYFISELELSIPH